jgi:hypothetical protein
MTEAVIDQIDQAANNGCFRRIDEVREVRAQMQDSR